MIMNFDRFNQSEPLPVVHECECCGAEITLGDDVFVFDFTPYCSTECVLDLMLECGAIEKTVAMK